MTEQARILFVDDEPNVLRALRRLFLDDDYEILTAPGAQEGLRILEETQPVQVVISDYRMPGIDGVEFLREVCRRWPDTVRIVLSGYADTATVVDAVNEGQIYKFIAKPWDDHDLRVTVANALERHRLVTENARINEELKKANEELRVINENLESLVEQQTRELVVQNAILSTAHEILDSLPVAVIGVDTEGLVVQANRMAIEMLAGPDSSIVGKDRRAALPDVLNSFHDRVLAGTTLCEKTRIRGLPAVLLGCVFGGHTNARGVIITVYTEEVENAPEGTLPG